MSHATPLLKTTPVDIPPKQATHAPLFYINHAFPNRKKVKMPIAPRKPVLSATARTLMYMFDDLSIEEIYLLEDIMKENKETDVGCWVVDQVTNWVYEDTDCLMPVTEAYRMVKLGILNE